MPSTKAQNQRSTNVLVSQTVSLGLLLMSLALIGLALGTLFFPKWSSETYGLPVDESASAWVMATGLRDGVLGLITLSKFFNRSGLLLYLGAVLLLPFGDAALVLSHGKPWMDSLPHLAGCVAILALIGLVWQEQRSASRSH